MFQCAPTNVVGDVLRARNATMRVGWLRASAEAVDRIGGGAQHFLCNDAPLLLTPVAAFYCVRPA